MTTETVKLNDQELSQVLAANSGDPTLSASIWGADVVSIRFDWPPSTAAFGTRTGRLRRQMRAWGFEERHLGPEPVGAGVLVVFDRNAAYDRQVRARMENGP